MCSGAEVAGMSRFAGGRAVRKEEARSRCAKATGATVWSGEDPSACPAVGVEEERGRDYIQRLGSTGRLNFPDGF